jgi:hypothetical protein
MQKTKFNTVQKAVDYSYLFLEELLSIDLAPLDPAEKDFLFSQLEKSVRITLSVLKKNG